MDQEQFLDVIDRDEAERRFRAALDLRPLGAEAIALSDALGRVLAEDVPAPLDVPAFDRSNVDGFAVRSADTFGASDDAPRWLALVGPTLNPGPGPRVPVGAGQAVAVATGAMLPRGADAVVMIEQTDAGGGRVAVRRPVAPAANVTFAGTDIGRGEVVLRRGERLTSRETGVLAALGLDTVRVVRRPRVAILSTGDELVAPGRALPSGCVYDSNSAILADAVRELGGEPVVLGIVPDDAAALDRALQTALREDAILLSGGTSKGPGDLSYRAVARLGPPGVLAHGVALKPGKPLCLAATAVDDARGRRVAPVVVLPGFPTSAIFTFREFVAPVLRRLAGIGEDVDAKVVARLPQRVNSEPGRTEYLLVSLVQSADVAESPALTAYPMGKGSGSVTAFSRADGFVVIPRQREYLEAGAVVSVHLLGRDLRPADLVVIGSHCLGLDFLLGELESQGIRTKCLSVGSSGGLDAARRGECDIAGVHLLDPVSGGYNTPFLGPGLRLAPGYGRLQGIVFRPGDLRFEHRSPREAVAAALADPDCVLVNRNRGSGTRVVIDQLLGAARPAGFLTEARSHNAVVAAVAQGRADWGVAISTAARLEGLGFLPLQPEQYDFVVPETRWNRPAVVFFRELLRSERARSSLAELGFAPTAAIN